MEGSRLWDIPVTGACRPAAGSEQGCRLLSRPPAAPSVRWKKGCTGQAE